MTCAQQPRLLLARMEYFENIMADLAWTGAGGRLRMGMRLGTVIYFYKNTVAGTGARVEAKD